MEVKQPELIKHMLYWIRFKVKEFTTMLETE